MKLIANLNGTRRLATNIPDALEILSQVWDSPVWREHIAPRCVRIETSQRPSGRPFLLGTGRTTWDAISDAAAFLSNRSNCETLWVIK